MHARLAAEPGVDEPLSVVRVVESGRAGDDVVVAVAVHVAGGHRVAEPGIVLIDGPLKEGGIHQARRRAQVDAHEALVKLTVVVLRRTDDEVPVAVAVHVARRGEARAKLCSRLVGLHRPGRGRAEARDGAVPDLHPPLVGLAVVVQGGRDREVGQGIAVDVAHECHGGAEGRAGLSARLVPGRSRGEALGAAQIQEGRALARVGAGVAGCPHDEVAVAVAVHVPTTGHGLSKGFLVDGAREHQGRGGLDAVRIAHVDVDLAPVGAARIGPGRTHGDVVVAVAVDVAHLGDRAPEVGSRLVGGVHVGLGRVADATAGPAVVDIDAAGVGAARVIVLGAVD